jgi:hypothetical protein
LINKDNNILFSSAHGTFEMLCNLEYGFEIIGEVDENIDASLSEAHEDIRMFFELEIQDVSPENAINIAWFCFDSDKMLTIDGSTFGVVNASGNYNKKIELWEKSNFAGTVKLAFRRKMTGIDYIAPLVDDEGEPIVDDAGEDIYTQ